MTETPYIFLQKKSFTTSLKEYLELTPTPCFIVTHLAHIYFIAEITKKTSSIKKNIPPISPSILLISPANAVSYMGVRWWSAFMSKALPILSQFSVTHILDCYDQAGLAMAALRAGQKHIFFESKSPQFTCIKNRAKTSDAEIIHIKPKTFDLLKLNFKKNHLL